MANELNIKHPKRNAKVLRTFAVGGVAKSAAMLTSFTAKIYPVNPDGTPRPGPEINGTYIGKKKWGRSGGRREWWIFKFINVAIGHYRLKVVGSDGVNNYPDEVPVFEVVQRISSVVSLNSNVKLAPNLTITTIPTAVHPPQLHNIYYEVPYFYAFGTRDPGYLNAVVKATVQPDDAYEIEGEVFDDEPSLCWAATFDLSELEPEIPFILLRIEDVLGHAKNIIISLTTP